MLVFRKKFSFSSFPIIVFLCGNKYSKNDSNDKRNILKEYIEEKHIGFRAIILEENFFFQKTNLNFLSYDDVFLRNLEQVEQLASIFADKIIIIHETISTGAELGMFAASLKEPSKICLLFPDSYSVDERKITSFINYAFFNGREKSEQINKIAFYPDVSIRRLSNETSYYISSFHNNCIGNHLGADIDNFILSNSLQNKTIRFKKYLYNISSDNNIEYCFQKKKNKLQVYVSSQALKYQLCSIISIKDVISELRKGKTIKQHVEFLCKTYRQIMKNTISELYGFDFSKTYQYIHLKEYQCKIEQAIGYFFYMLQGASLIELYAPDKSNLNIRKIIIKMDFKKIINQSSNLLYDKKESEFERRFK